MLLQGSATPIIRTGLRAAYGYLVVYSGLLVFGLMCLIWSVFAAFLGYALPDVACVMKAKLIDNPIYGASARLSGYIRNDDFIGAPTQAVQNLRSGSQLLLFPEGTRTTRAPINRLKGGAALVSKRSGVPIQ